jgi:FAD-dependent monooxygenase
MHDTPVLIVGAGPVGLLLAKELSHHGIASTLVERNLDTTRWPKMDITNCRSMELMRRLGLDAELRRIGVPSQFSFDVLFSTGLAGREITRWSLDSVDQMNARIRACNDGTQPSQAWQRCSQELFEAWMKALCVADPLIDVQSGTRLESITQDADSVTATLSDSGDGRGARTIRTRYLVGCDGATSAVRKSLGIELDGGPVPRIARLVHFKSRDLKALHAQGQFWHIFFTHPSTLISQDEVDTWTLQNYFPVDVDPSGLDPVELVYRGVGRKIDIDRILVTSVWRGNILVARRYREGRVFLAGDSCHQNIPTGGYGMNTGVGDAVSIGWKLAAVLKGWGGPGLLDAYETERRPVAQRNVARSGEHAEAHTRWRSLMDLSLVDADGDKADAHRAMLGAHIRARDNENLDLGIEIGYRYNESPVIVHEGSAEPAWSTRTYTPSTWPGARPPSVFLADGSNLFDQFSTGFTLLELGAGDGTRAGADAIASAAAARGVPLKRVPVSESGVRDLYERDLVLIRPDQHVAWRGNAAPTDALALMDRVRGATVN